MFGLAGVIGSILFSKLFRGHENIFIISMFAGTSLMLFLLNPSAQMFATVAAVIFFWGLCYIAFNTSLQSHLLSESPKDATPIIMYIYSGLYNVGIASGSLIGGGVTDTIGVGYVGFVGAAFACISTLILVFYLLPKLNKKRQTA